MNSGNNSMRPADERTLILDGLSKIIAELIPKYPQRLQALTGSHSISATAEYRGNTITYSLDEQGELIAMSSAEPSTPYVFGQSSVPNAVDIFSVPEHDIARAMILYWHKKISLGFGEAMRQLETEHEIFEKFDAAYDPKKSFLGLG